MNTTVTYQLRNEHHCLQTLADRIEQQLHQAGDGSEAHFARLLDQVQELRHQFVNAHLPKEQLLVRRLTRKAGDATRLMADFLNGQSVLFLQQLERLEADLKALLLDQLVSRSAIVETGIRAIEHLRSQIALEEEATLPWAAQRMGDDEWLEIDRQVADRKLQCEHASAGFSCC
ncbi:MAG: hypothetical protein OQL28_11095 [Sedimenticola sp.]|nr:hypothetical protein [Sedimenticola sp.]